MSDLLPDSSPEVERLRERVRKLALEKSYFQLVMQMIMRIGSAPGLSGVIDNLLACTMEILGGSNIKLYYRIDEALFYADALGERRQLAKLDDAAVARVFAHGQPEEIEGEFADTLLTTPEFTKAYTWLYPLAVGESVLGVLKAENLHIDMRRLYSQLPSFFNFAALALKNEILGESRLARLYRQLSETQLAMDRAGIGMHRVDATSGKFLEVNDHAAAMLGYSREELLALGVPGIDPNFTAGQFAEQTQALRESGSANIETVNLHRDGRLVPVGVTFYHHAAADGGPGEFIAFIVDISQRKAAEELERQAKERLEVLVAERTAELARSHRLLDSIVENIPNMIFLKRASDLRFELFNRAGEALLGLPRTELLGKNDYDFFPKEQADFFTGRDRETLAQEGVVDIPEEPIETPKGTRFLHTRKMALRNESGEPAYLLGISEEITERKRMLERLEQSEREYHSLIQQLQVAVVVHNADTSIRIFNEQACTLLGLTPEQMSGKTAFDPAWHFCDEEETPLSPEQYPVNRVLAKKAALSEMVAGVFRPAIGDRIWALCSARPTLNATGEVEQVVVTFIDISERRRAQQQLAENERRLREAQRIAHLGNWQLDLTHNRLEWSEEIFRIFEIDPQQFGASYEAFLAAIHPDDRAMVDAAYRRSLCEQQPYEIVHRLLMKDGRIKHVQEQCETRFDAGGKPLLSFGTVCDISELKQAEEEIRRFNSELEQLVEQRTGELRETNRRLEQFNELMVEREMRVVEIKQEFNRFCVQNGGEPPYREVWDAQS